MNLISAKYRFISFLGASLFLLPSLALGDFSDSDNEDSLRRALGRHAEGGFLEEVGVQEEPPDQQILIGGAPPLEEIFMRGRNPEDLVSAEEIWDLPEEGMSLLYRNVLNNTSVDPTYRPTVRFCRVFVALSQLSDDFLERRVLLDEFLNIHPARVTDEYYKVAWRLCTAFKRGRLGILEGLALVPSERLNSNFCRLGLSLMMDEMNHDQRRRIILSLGNIPIDQYNAFGEFARTLMDWDDNAFSENEEDSLYWSTTNVTEEDVCLVITKLSSIPPQHYEAYKCLVLFLADHLNQPPMECHSLLYSLSPTRYHPVFQIAPLIAQAGQIKYSVFTAFQSVTPECITQALWEESVARSLDYVSLPEAVVSVGKAHRDRLPIVRKLRELVLPACDRDNPSSQFLVKALDELSDHCCTEEFVKFLEHFIQLEPISLPHPSPPQWSPRELLLKRASAQPPAFYREYEKALKYFSKMPGYTDEIALSLATCPIENLWGGLCSTYSALIGLENNYFADIRVVNCLKFLDPQHYRRLIEQTNEFIKEGEFSLQIRLFIGCTFAKVISILPSDRTLWHPYLVKDFMMQGIVDYSIAGCFIKNIIGLSETEAEAFMKKVVVLEHALDEHILDNLRKEATGTFVHPTPLDLPDEDFLLF